MSLIPFILDLADELHEFSRCLANGIDINDFGFGLYTGTDHQPHQQQQQQQQQTQPQTSPRRSRTSSFSSFWMPSKRHHPYNRIKTACCAKSGDEPLTNTEKSDTSSSSIGGTPGKSASYSVVNKNGFQVSMNVKQFAPNELSVKTIDNCIVVEGRHDDKEDGHGVISRHFVRKYMLPKGYDPNDVLSTLSSDGILTVKAPPPPPAAKTDESNERVIEIQPTPGPTPVLVVSAKEMPVRESTKKLPTTVLSRSECQLPEPKRQKLDFLPESESEEPAEAPVLAATAIGNDSDVSLTPTVGTEMESNDVEMEKADEQIVVKRTEHQTKDVTKTGNDIEKNCGTIEQQEQLFEKEETKSLDETENKLLNECLAESNIDSKIICEKMEESCCVADSAESADKIKANSTEIEKSVEHVTKIDVHGEDEGHNIDDENMGNTENVVAAVKTVDSESKTTILAAAGAGLSGNSGDTAAGNIHNTDTSTSYTSKTTTNVNNSSTNNSSNATTIVNSNSPEAATIDFDKNVKGGNGVVTGEIPDDIPTSADCDADTTTSNKPKYSTEDKAESVADGENETETAVLCTDTTTDIINDVVLLKAATADSTAIADNKDGNIRTESVDGIATKGLSPTAVTTVDNVECSLFAKKTHLGNGTNTTATPIVGTEEMAN